MEALEWSQYFSHCKSMGIFFRRSRAANSTVQGRIWLNFELIWTLKNKEDPIKNGGARMFTTLYIDFSDAEGQVTS